MENGFYLKYGNELPKTIEIVESLVTFETADEARVWALKNVRGHSVVNKHTGMFIRIGRRALEKTTSGSSVLKSTSRTAHFAAVSVLIALLERAVLIQSHPDRHNNPDIRPIHRFFAAFSFRGDLFRVKLTVKEFAQRLENSGFYTYELAQIEMPDGKQAASCSEKQTSAPPPGKTNLTEFLGGASV